MLASTDGLPGPVIVNRFGNSGDLDAEQRAGPIGPRVAQQLAVTSPDVDAIERAGHRVEAGGEDDDVELVVTLGGPNPSRRDLLDPAAAQVHERHVVLVERLVVVGVEDWPFASDGEIAR